MSGIVPLLLVLLLQTLAAALAADASRNQSGVTRSAYSAQPSVFLITIDTLRPDHVGCYGARDVRTPALNQLASDGIRFAQALTPVPLTNASHASILTGRYPSAHGVSDFGTPLNNRVATWAEILKAHGYKTAAFIGAAILDSNSMAPGFNRGFDFYDNFNPNMPSNVHWDRLERRGETVVKHALAWLKTHPSGPYFIWLHLYDPHDPYDPPQPYATEFKSRPYDGEIAYADHALGLFLQNLKAAHNYNPALIVALADHGEGLGEHHEMTHGIFLYDSTLLVPFILKLPENHRAGVVVNNQVRTIDVLPTVLDILKISPETTFDGSSLLREGKDQEHPSSVALGETSYPSHFGWAPLHSARSAGFKFIDAPRPELYNLDADPGEASNIYEPWNPAVQALRSDLAGYRAKIGAGRTEGSAPVSQRTIDELHALGYFPKIAGSTTVEEPSLLPDPKDKIEIHNLLHEAMVEEEAHRSSQAEKALRQALQIDPKLDSALAQLGEIELNSGRIQEAVRDLRQAAQINPGNADVSWHLGEALEKAGDREGASQALESSLKTRVGNLQARMLLARIYGDAGRFKDAADQLESILLIQPNQNSARIQLAQLLIVQKNYAQAAGQLEKARAIDRSNPEIYRLLAKVYSLSGDNARAQAAKQRQRQLSRSR